MTIADSVHELPMRWADLDSLDHVNNVVYLDYSAESRALLVEDGVLDPVASISDIAIRYVRPLRLTRRPVTVMSAIEGDTLTQQICVDRDGVRTIFAEIATTFGAPAAVSAELIGIDSVQVGVRRSDVDMTGVVAVSKTFELFQEGRILYLAQRLEDGPLGRFVVGTIEVDFHAPIRWRREPYDLRNRVTRVGAASLTIETELADGDLALGRARTHLVGFDLETQTSRRFSDEELTLYRAMLAEA